MIKWIQMEILLFSAAIGRYVYNNDNTLPQYDGMDEEGNIINLG